MNTKEYRKVSYFNEISMMMYGFGDSHEPNPETVRLVESIVLSQLRVIVNEALKYGKSQSLLNGEDLIFLLRHNKYKMQRMVHYLRNKEIAQKAKTGNVIEIDPEKNKLIDFIEKLDETGEFMDTSDTDHVRLERMVRADRIAQNLNEVKYLEFHKARCSSFKGNRLGLNLIRTWVDPKEEIVFAPEALDILQYFAFQTVADITDYALLAREDAKSGSDPLGHLPGSYYTASMFNGGHRFAEKKPDYTRVYSGQPPISVGEIKEVMRRLYTPQAGRLNFGGRVTNTHYIFAL